jgi:UDP-GlcNAc:undecaprenyl-phosphate/decaprenyl-phosphate GlcNAc-1-phosphate transferase
MVDHPAARKVHVTPTPLGGGLAIWLAVVMPLAGAEPSCGWFTAARSQPIGCRLWRPFIWTDWSSKAASCGSAGRRDDPDAGRLADDRWGLGWKPSLAVQFLIAAACVSGRAGD